MKAYTLEQIQAVLTAAYKDIASKCVSGPNEIRQRGNMRMLESLMGTMEHSLDSISPLEAVAGVESSEPPKRPDGQSCRLVSTVFADGQLMVEWPAQLRVGSDVEVEVKGAKLQSASYSTNPEGVEAGLVLVCKELCVKVSE